MAETIRGMKLSDGTEINVAGLTYTSVTSKGNLEISTPAGGKLNLESADNMALKPSGKLQLDTHKYDPATETPDEFKIAVINDKASKVEGIKLETAGIKIVTGSADATYWDPDTFKVMVKKTTGSTDTWAKMNMHAAAIDLRTRVTGPGTGGGIAAQIASCDSDGHENKFKVETSRKIDVFQPAGDYSQTYVMEGGKGIEIYTLNSQFESAYTKEMRRGADTRLFAVSRGPVSDDGTGKFDYPTQPDDSKDVKDSTQPEVKWVDLINAAIYLKKQGLIPSDGSILS